jgi:hypothetical protein
MPPILPVLAGGEATRRGDTNIGALHAAVIANLGTNPSLTIAAQAERACAFWPNRGETDPRPRWAHATSGWSRWHSLQIVRSSS